MYIDPITDSLQSLSGTAANMNRIKAQYEEDQLRRAELLNRMGQNESAEKALWDANNSGLLTRYLPNKARPWEVDAPFSDIKGEELDSLNSLSADAIEGQKLSGLDDKGLNALALSSLAGDFADTRDMTGWGNVSDNTVATDKLRSLDGKMINDDFVANEVFSSGGDEVAPQMVGDPVLKPLPFKTKGIADSNPYTREYKEKIAAYQKEKAANDKIEAGNKEKEKRNSEIPSFSRVYKGDETDQLTQLNHDARRAIKYYLNRGDETSAMLAYDTYVTTGNSIAQRYQHQFKAIDAKSLFGKPKGGGGGTGEKGEKYVYGDDPLTAQTIHIPDYVYNKGEKAIESYVKKTWPSIYKEGTRIKRAGTNQSDDYDAVKDAQAKKLQDENSLTANAAWEALVDKYDNVITSRSKAREKALAELKAQGKDVRMDQYGRYVIIDVAGNNRNVVQNNPEDEVVF